jgi:lipopolysaccharide transport system permease protein
MKTVISPHVSWTLEWKELYQNRELLYFFTLRNFKIRYKQTLLGALWAVFRPLILMVVFTFAFSNVGGIEGADGIPYPIFSYAGLLFWLYFSQTLVQVSSSMVQFQSVISKIYFPRLIIPFSIAATGLVDMFFASLVYVALLIIYKVPVSLIGVSLFIPLVVISFFAVLGIGLYAAALNVKYRDVAQAIPFAVQALLFLTPVIYPVASIPASYQWALYLNPITGVIEVFRASLFGYGDINYMHISISLISTIILFLLGLNFFKNKEREFADYI